MEIVKTPWRDKLLELVSNSEKSIKITSPFVKENICDAVLEAKPTNATFELVTSFKLMNIYAKSIDINGIEKIIKANGIVKNFSKLHAKIYLFDDKEVIITSANLTNGGLLHNYEYGIYSNDQQIVEQTLTDFNSISQNEDIGNVALEEIRIVRDLLSKIPPSDGIKLPNYQTENPANALDIIELDNSIIEDSLSGWKLEVFRCVHRIPKQIFTLSDINQFEHHLKAIYPLNNNILPKIRQQLQYLRDLGLIEFLGNGKYRKLWKKNHSK